MGDVGRNVPIGKGDHYIIVNAGSEKGFVPGAGLLFKAKSSTGDFHSEMNRANFQKWVGYRTWSQAQFW